MKTQQVFTTNNLKALRLQHGLKQKEVPTLLGMRSEDRISHWEKGQAMPSVQNLFKLCEIYKVNPFEIYTILKKIT